MTFHKILQYPESEFLLRKKSINVKNIDKRVRELIQDLKDTLEHHGGGAGLAAPQIGIQLRIAVVRFGQDEGETQPPLALINPIITKAGILTKGYDGCLSIPGLVTWDTPRPSVLTFCALDERGTPFEMEVRGMDARLVHHEIDHLNGVLYLDRLEDLRKLYRVVQTEAGEKLVSLTNL